MTYATPDAAESGIRRKPVIADMIRDDIDDGPQSGYLLLDRTANLQAPMLRQVAGKLYRATNEDTNGLIRQFFSKGTDLARIPEHRFIRVQDLLNNRSRKRLGYRAPHEVLASRRLVAIET